MDLQFLKKQAQVRKTNTSYMGPLLVLIRLALQHRHTVNDRMNTRRDTTTARIINDSPPG